MSLNVRFVRDSAVVWRPARERDIRRFLALLTAHISLRTPFGSIEDLSSRLGTWPVLQDHSMSVGLTQSHPKTTGHLQSSPQTRASDGASAWLACASLPGEPIAFVMLDGADQSLLVVRDYLGCIPISFAVGAAGEVILASRAESIAASLDGRCRVDEARVADLLVGHLQWLDLSATFYHEIHRVPGGCAARIRAEVLTISRYWLPKVSSLPRGWTSVDYAEALGGLLDVAVASCIPTDGGMPAVMLSGGIDSNAVAGLAAARIRGQSKASLATYSVIDSVDLTCSETAAIREAMASPGLDATALDLRAIGVALPQLQVEMFDVDEPWDASLSLLRWIYSAAAANGQLYVMDGIDADSLLGEGDPVTEIARQLRALQLPSAFRNARGMDRHWEGKSRFMRQMLSAAAWRAMVPGRLRGALQSRRRILSGSARMAELLENSPIRPEFARQVDLLARQARYEAEELEQGVMDMRSPIIGVERYARAAARSGVVPLHPFLDTRVVEFCLALPQSQRLADGWPKYVLRSAMRGVVPENLVWRHGKRHLGWRLTRVLAEQLSPPLHIRLAQLRDVLHPYIDPHWFRRLTAAPAIEEEDVGWSIDLVALGKWLSERRNRL